jgi:serine/threonine protein kinase
MLTKKSLVVGHHNVQIIDTVSQGAFGFVYLVEDRKEPTRKMALKVSITQNKERYELAEKELLFLKNNSNEENDYFVQYIDSFVEKLDGKTHRFFLLMEYGSFGTLFNLIDGRNKKNEKLSEDEILKLARAINRSLIKLHEMDYVHCDIKIENLLFYSMNKIKMCDFGSINKYNIDFENISKNEMEKFVEEFDRQTTFMYRPPEMCDVYLKYQVNTQVDMWMLGCVLFTLMFFKHPFLNSSKAGIINASYFWPENSDYSKKLEFLVRNLLTPNPTLRYSAKQLEDILNNWHSFESISLNDMAKEIFITHRKRHFIKKQKDDDLFDFSGLDKMNNHKKNTENGFNFQFDGKANSKKENNFDFFDFQKKDENINNNAFDGFNNNLDDVQGDDYKKFNKNYYQPQNQTKTQSHNLNTENKTNNKQWEDTDFLSF